MGERFSKVEAGELVISVAPHGAGAVVHVGGVLDAEVAPVLKRELSRLEGYSTIEVDLNSLAIVDSAGIHALVDARESADEAGRNVELRIGDGRVRRILELAGVDSLLEAPL